MNGKTAVQFPGQGAYYRGALRELKTKYPEITETFREIDQVARAHFQTSITEHIHADHALEPEALLKTAPHVLQLALYGVAISVQRVLRGLGFEPDVFVGHSSGEITAMVAAGTFSGSEGAAIMRQRKGILRTSGPG